jgi:hypothetical protein
MELTTILNHCYPHRGFVYDCARFSPDKKSIEVTVRPRRGANLDFSREVLTKGRIPTPKHMYQDMFWRERKRPLL